HLGQLLAVTATGQNRLAIGRELGRHAHLLQVGRGVGDAVRVDPHRVAVHGPTGAVMPARRMARRDAPLGHPPRKLLLGDFHAIEEKDLRAVVFVGDARAHWFLAQIPATAICSLGCTLLPNMALAMIAFSASLVAPPARLTRSYVRDVWAGIFGPCADDSGCICPS